MLDSILGIVRNISNWFTPERRIQRLKDELDRLETERAMIYVTKANMAQAKRLARIESRIDAIQRMLRNAAD